MEIKDPHTRLFVFSALVIAEIVLLYFILQRNIDFTSFDNWLSSLLLPTILFLINFAKQWWVAYKEVKRAGAKK
ncbi:hypothetical protein [Dyadobacter sp. 3J3]|uniref:hypothetical protein n=1 Tax=Dyadobacter sp. 3J3 TaxID=2606600 RepID=UPI00135AC6E2|nr:hypothetical protein [Dyadobacter sp. 3J3]